MCSTVGRLPACTLSDTPACSHPTSHTCALAVPCARNVALYFPRTLGTSRALFLVASVTHSRTPVLEEMGRRHHLRRDVARWSGSSAPAAWARLRASRSSVRVRRRVVRCGEQRVGAVVVPLPVKYGPLTGAAIAG